MDSNTLVSSRSHIASLDHTEIQRACPQVHWLVSEQLLTMLSAGGGGFVQSAKLAVTRWQPDPTCDLDGYYIYLRDLESGDFWSATYQPTLVKPDLYEVDFHTNYVRFVRRNFNLHSELEVFHAAEHGVEFRRLTLTNEGKVARTIELTSYAELVLQEQQADAAHPAYSKLFVESWRDDAGVLYARRRPREAGQTTLAACHFWAGESTVEQSSFETDRASFLGRGNSLAAPVALSASRELSGKLGSVLDPIFSLRRVVFLVPGETVSVCFALAASTNVDQLTQIAEKFHSPGAVAIALRPAQGAVLEGQANSEQNDNVQRGL